jgi:hypothetical protein
MADGIWYNKTGKVYSLDYTDISEVFFTPHYVGHCCTNVIWGQCHALYHSCTNVIHSHCCALGRCYNNVMWSHCVTTVRSNNDLSSHGCAILCSNNGNQVFSQLHNNDTQSCRSFTPVRKQWQTVMDGPIRCSSLMLECEQHLKNDNFFRKGNRLWTE